MLNVMVTMNHFDSSRKYLIFWSWRQYGKCIS